jgi:XTP/dITP diphosphohydrolase
MPRRFVLASDNRGKLAEIVGMLEGTSIQVLPQSRFGVVSVEETGLTFVENAILKARAASLAADLPAIADDSGLEVDALRGAPGVRSARFAGDDASDQENNQLLLDRLKNVAAGDRGARFRCVIVCLQHPKDPAPVVCEGVWEGAIAFQPSGSWGFGYDPLFLPADATGTAAELSSADKNRLSHRGKALRQLVEMLREC